MRDYETDCESPMYSSVSDLRIIKRGVKRIASSEVGQTFALWLEKVASTLKSDQDGDSKA
jgi:hypothetical protein